MTVKRKDFQKLANTVHQFLMKLTDTYECAELRDILNMSLVQMQKYYRKCQQRLQHTGRHNIENTNGYVSPRQSLRFKVTSDRPMSPMTPYIEEPYYFHVKWTVLDQPNVSDKLWKSFESSCPPSLMQPMRSLNTPPAHYAAMKHDLDLLLELVTEKPNILEDQDCIGRTPLMYSIYHNNFDVAKWLLKRGADPNSCDYDEMTSLHWACYLNNTRMIELLLEAGATLNYQDSFGRSPCHWASTCETIETLQLLLEYAPNVNLHDKNGLTPAMWACRLDKISNMKLLLAVPNQVIDHIDGFERDRNGRTIIHWSIRRQTPLGCLDYLLNNHEMGQLRDDEGKTVLLLAAEQGALESCKLIVKVLGTSVINDVDDKDHSCLHLATSAGHGEVVNFLLECGANIYSKDRTGATCLDIAINHYLYYCHLIISSHIRSMEKRKDSDCVELIEKASSRHNSISELRVLPRSPPRQPKSPKSPKTPPSSSRKRLTRYPSNIEEVPNGFDVMTSDPIRENNYADSNKQTSSNVLKLSDKPSTPIEKSKMNGPNIDSGFGILDYEAGGPVDYLNTDTGQEYHKSENQHNKENLNTPIKMTQNNIKLHDNISSNNLANRRFNRAQKNNKLSIVESVREADDNLILNSPNKINPRFSRGPVNNNKDSLENTNIENSLDNILHDLDNPSIGGTHRDPNISSPASPSRINYGASLEPLQISKDLNSWSNNPDENPLQSSQIPRRNKRRPRNVNGRKAVSQDRRNQASDINNLVAPIRIDQGLSSKSLESLAVARPDVIRSNINNTEISPKGILGFNSDRSFGNKLSQMGHHVDNNMSSPTPPISNTVTSKLTSANRPRNHLPSIL